MRMLKLASPFVAILALAIITFLYVDSVRLSKLSPDERIVFFDTAARYDARSESWVVPVHAWIHEPASSLVRRKTIEKALEVATGIEIDDEPSGELRTFEVR